jgi:Co/Zn/Cd efflux system component
MTETKNKETPSSPFIRSARDERYIRKVTWAGLVVNQLLSGLKLFAGIVGASQAIVADAIHSLSDSVTDVAVLIGRITGPCRPLRPIPTATVA